MAELLSHYGLVVTNSNQNFQNRNSLELTVLNSINVLKQTDDVHFLLMMRALDDAQFAELATQVFKVIDIFANKLNELSD